MGRLPGSASSITVTAFRFFDAGEGPTVDFEALDVFFVVVVLNVFVFLDFDFATSGSGHSTREDLRTSLAEDTFDAVEVCRDSSSSSPGSCVVLLVFLRFGAEDAD
jgi:hypothetical protein